MYFNKYLIVLLLLLAGAGLGAMEGGSGPAPPLAVQPLAPAPAEAARAAVAAPASSLFYMNAEDLVERYEGFGNSLPELALSQAVLHTNSAKVSATLTLVDCSENQACEVLAFRERGLNWLTLGGDRSMTLGPGESAVLACAEENVGPGSTRVFQVQADTDPKAYLAFVYGASDSGGAKIYAIPTLVTPALGGTAKGGSGPIAGDLSRSASKALRGRDRWPEVREVAPPLPSREYAQACLNYRKLKPPVLA